MYIHNLNPVLINIGFLEIRWYSLAYIFGILLGWWLGKKILFFRLNKESKSSDYCNFDDLISHIIISIILGGRMGYVVFYNLSYYIQNPIDIFKIWEGGMSFHGALLGLIIATYTFAKNRNLNTLILLDIIACVAPIGIFFGRLANFINAELYGKVTNNNWGVIFPKVDSLLRHPSQLYEAFLEGVILFFILILLTLNKKVKTGIVSGSFLILYGFFRIVAENFREPDTHIGYIFNFLTMGSLLSVIMIFFGIVFIKNVIKK
jgi:phosphatidylglycerol:prolipoprotein diacylglycerol transferase